MYNIGDKVYFSYNFGKIGKAEILSITKINKSFLFFKWYELEYILKAEDGEMFLGLESDLCGKVND